MIGIKMDCADTETLEVEALRGCSNTPSNLQS